MTALSTKTLIVRPEDVEGVALGGSSSVAGVTVTAEYDRTIEAGAEVLPKGIRTPLKWDASVGHWGINLVASDDPAITSGQGACVVVRIEVQHRQGRGSGGNGHGRGLTYAKAIQIVTSDPALIPYGSKESMQPVPVAALNVSPQQVNDAVTNAAIAQDAADGALMIAQQALEVAQQALAAAQAGGNGGTANPSLMVTVNGSAGTATITSTTGGVTDNGDGTYTLSSGAVDNGDGTYTITY